MTDRRLASLDFLRGVAALSVAIPHFFVVTQAPAPLAESISILGVEIFFVLSGYVLAPQILFYVFERPNLHNAGIFLVRRWMRTLPPYLIALLLTTASARAFATTDFLRYLFYVQNFVRQSNSNDYFSIAWSLSVEEWFYLLFPPFVAAAAALLPKGQRRPARSAACFIIAITLLRVAFGDNAQWGSEVRRIVMFRMDAIAWGFLLHLAVARAGLLDRIRLWQAVILFGALLGISLALTLVMAEVEVATIEQLFPFYAAALGGSAIVAALKARDIFDRMPKLARLGTFLGRVSYSTYLFHLLVLSALEPFIRSLGWPLMLAAYLAATIAVAALMYTAIEAPVLAARPRFDNLGGRDR